MNLLFFGLLMTIPWVLGFLLVRLFLRPRFGHVAFSIGAGYLLGWFLCTLLFYVYDYFGRPFDIMEFSVIESIFCLLLLVLNLRVFRFTKLQSSTSASLTSNSVIFIIIILIGYRCSLTFIDITTLPVFSWDGWLSWSAKAKVFYYYDSVSLRLGHPNSVQSLFNNEVVTVYGARHPYFISLIQTYTALAWGEWDDNVVNLPWLGLKIAFVFLIFGGLRYLGMSRLVSLIASYAVISLPILDTHVTLGSYADVWVGFGLLCSVFLATFLLAFNEYRLIAFVLFFSIIVYFTKHSSLPFLTVSILLVSFRFFGIWSFFILTFITGASLFSLNHLMDKSAHRFFSEYLGSRMPKIVYNPVVEPLIEQWFIIDNWHIAFSLIIISMLFLFRKKGSYEPQKQFNYIVYAGVFCLVILLFIIFYTSKLALPYFSSYINRVSLYIMPLLTLVPFCIYQLKNHSQLKT